MQEVIDQIAALELEEKLKAALIKELEQQKQIMQVFSDTNDDLDADLSAAKKEVAKLTKELKATKADVQSNEEEIRALKKQIKKPLLKSDAELKKTAKEYLKEEGQVVFISATDGQCFSAEHHARNHCNDYLIAELKSSKVVLQPKD